MPKHPSISDRPHFLRVVQALTRVSSAQPIVLVVGASLLAAAPACGGILDPGAYNGGESGSLTMPEGPSPDAAEVPYDGGFMGVDASAGPLSPDAEAERPDAAHDAASVPPHDGGPLGADAGFFIYDGGLQGVDSGIVIYDGGVNGIIVPDAAQPVEDAADSLDAERGPQ